MSTLGLTANDIEGIDGDISPDGSKYYLLVQDTTTNKQGIFTIMVADSTLIRYREWG